MASFVAYMKRVGSSLLWRRPPCGQPSPPLPVTIRHSNTSYIFVYLSLSRVGEVQWRRERDHSSGPKLRLPTTRPKSSPKISRPQLGGRLSRSPKDSTGGRRAFQMFRDRRANLLTRLQLTKRLQTTTDRTLLATR